MWVGLWVGMARTINRLSARTVASISQPGYHADGAGLYRQVSFTGGKSWIFRSTLHGRSREMGLRDCTARYWHRRGTRRKSCRRQLRDGRDPIAIRKGERDAARLAAARVMTFETCAHAYIEAHQAGWRNAKHADQ